MREERRVILIVKASILVGNPGGLHIIANTQLGQPERRGVCSMMLSAATLGDVLVSKEVAVAFALRVEHCIELLGATVERTQRKGEYPCMPDERTGAAAVVAAGERPHGNLE